MAAVLPRFQDRGIGRELKLKQREEALARGLDLIEWTFDPLELKNAHFNIVRLGAMVRRILPNQYGRTSSPLHAGIPTDRFVAEWWIRSDRVTQALAGRPWNGEPRVRVELPADLGRMKNTSPAAVEALQHRLREELSTWFARGYIITGLEQTGGTAAYLLQDGLEVTGVGLHEGTQ
jgi:predicted GNAT superfamily acetyltransferase